MIFKSLCLLYRGRFLPLGRLAFRKVITKGRSQKSPEILLPPFIAVQELRLMLNIDYTSCFRLCKVSISRNKYSWKDIEGRSFECSNKRHVLVCFDTAAYVCRSFGFNAIKVSPEPEVPELTSESAIPVIAVIGHKDHGKTSLLEKLTGKNLLEYEPVRTTQSLYAMTLPFTTHSNYLATFVDTPGDVLFDVLRGRAIHLADLALVVISAEGGELQTRDVILQADSFNVQILFCVNKIDLDYSNVDIVRSELKFQCNLMFNEGIISRNFESELDNLIPISVISGHNIDKLVEKIVTCTKSIKMPCNNIKYETFLGGYSLKKFDGFIRRANSLVSSGLPPTAVGFILEITKTESFGIVLTVIVRSGTIVEGNYFVAGTYYGRVTGIYPSGEKLSPKNKISNASVGTAVFITGMKNLEGTSVDDLLLVLPQHEAFRLSQYRLQLQILKASQVSGPLLQTHWTISLKSNNEQYYKSGVIDTTKKPNEVEDSEYSPDDFKPATQSESTTEYDESEDFPDEFPHDTDMNSHLTSIYLKPVEGDEMSDEFDPWTLKATIHNKELKERWQQRINERNPNGATNAVGYSNSKMERQSQIYEDTFTEDIGRPVIPIILRANFVGTFDSLLDGLDILEKEFNVRLPLVHGGVGPIVPNDIVQAEIGNKFTYCPVYAFQVPILNDAAKHAVINKITIKSFNLYSDLLDDVKSRCQHTLEKIAKRRYVEKLNE
ncbi:translation initiation factor IF-2, putative [Theileria equi strain WA]|uniref:Translation initiation factor IF-2, putative n=1 Tax=Theileria equi strain WA TaxID=1537102 RepID=L1LGK7_THEEQ|nr:translation initiation factor IF-2, putative [Theileria equi strain WA]EKX74390.1 translation initiation factor IF-2, putative [Theileria equi strain WA]|eukprot:XP_004833842.1 translation initiation factor IF-2, putative [Theileria equi strain WA]